MWTILTGQMSSFKIVVTWIQVVEEYGPHEPCWKETREFSSSVPGKVWKYNSFEYSDDPVASAIYLQASFHSHDLWLQMVVSSTPPKTPEKWWLEDDPFLLGWSLFRDMLIFREGKAVLRSSIQCFIAFAALGLQSQCQLGSWWCWPYSSSTPERVGILAQHTIVQILDLTQSQSQHEKIECRKHSEVGWWFLCIVKRNEYVLGI